MITWAASAFGVQSAKSNFQALKHKIILEAAQQLAKVGLPPSPPSRASTRTRAIQAG
jgi:hypothetical protein